MALSSAAGSKIPEGYSAGSLQQYNPDQMALFKRLFSMISPDSQLAKLAGGDESSFAPMEQRAARDFQQFSGQLGSRFSGANQGAGLGYSGQMSARRSGAFQNMATQGAQDFASQLSQQRQSLQRQAMMDLMGISNTLLGERPQEQFLVPKQKPFGQELMSGLSQGIGQGIGMLPMLAL